MSAKRMHEKSVINHETKRSDDGITGKLYTGSGSKAIAGNFLTVRKGVLRFAPFMTSIANV